MWAMALGSALGTGGGLARAYQARENDKAMFEAASLNIKNNIMAYYNAVRAAQAEIADAGAARNEALVARQQQGQREAGFIRAAAGGTGLLGNSLDRLIGTAGVRTATDVNVIKGNYDAGLRATGIRLSGLRKTTRLSNLALASQPRSYNPWIAVLGTMSSATSGALAASG